MRVDLECRIPSVFFSEKHEKCGFLIGTRSEVHDCAVPNSLQGVWYRVTRILVVPNVASQRTQRFAIKGKWFIYAATAAARRKEQVIGVIHSHPKGPSEPSLHDKEGLQENWLGGVLNVPGRTVTWFDKRTTWTKKVTQCTTDQMNA